MNNNELFKELIGYETPKTKTVSVSKTNPSFDFMGAVKKTLNEDPYNVSITENGAIGYRTTGKALLDLNFAVSSLRNKSEKEITDKFKRAFYETPLESLLWLFYLRDVRGGLGERRSFRILLKDLAKSHPKQVAVLIPYIAEYGRYDDLWGLLDTSLKDIVVELVKTQLIFDLQNMKENKSISLLGKWLPSRNASSRNTREDAKKLYKALGLDPMTYQKTCSALRKHLKIVERDMSAKRWTVINYNTVPAKANLIYNSAFLRNDEERRRAYLAALEKHDGTAKINAGTLFPHEIVNKYSVSRYGGSTDVTLEELWKALPDMVQGAGNVMVVADGSGSMTTRVDPHGTTRALDVANALAIYFAERSFGPYKDKYITFSQSPQYVDFSKCKTLRDKISCALNHNEVANTNIQAVFELILDTAKANHLKQEDLPGTILVISDMEFDSCATSSAKTGRVGWYGYSYQRVDKNLFKYITEEFAKSGYKMPRLVFWNVNSRTGTIPVKENDMGVALVSGFSTNIIKMVMSNKLDPYEALLEQLFTERYKPIYKALIPFYGERSEMEVKEN